MTPDNRDTERAPAMVDREFVELAADDLSDLADVLEGSLSTLRGLIVSMRQAAEARATK